MSVLLDSVILIDHLNGITVATRYLGSVRGAAISLISRAEVLAGPSAVERELIAEWLDRFPVLPMGVAEADLAAELRRKFKWRLPDAFQAASAQIHGMKLATRNTRDFPPQRHQFVIVPYTV
jgi:predicted nucleic acid-binding protein